jgi:Acetoacetate decarboxylase (ADC)
MNFYRDPFFCVPRSTHATSQGDVELPIFYYDSTAVLAFFRCDREKAAALLPAERFLPTLTGGASAIVGLALFEYRSTSIGTYNEVGLAIPALWKKGPVPRCPAAELFRSVYTRLVGFHIVDLPVTTARAHAAGRELWGYPKFITPIDFTLQKKQLDCCVHDPAGYGNIMTLEGKLGVGVPSPALDLVNFDRIGELDFRTIIQTRGRGHLCGRGNVHLRIGTSSHPMADHLYALGLDHTRPLVMWVSTRFQSRLNQGAPLVSKNNDNR